MYFDDKPDDFVINATVYGNIVSCMTPAPSNNLPTIMEGCE